MPSKVDIIIELDEDGRIADLNKRNWLRGQFALFGPGKARLQLSRPKRTSRANRYYWGCVIEAVHKGCLMAGIQTTPEALHEHFKEKYLPPRPIVGIDGEDRTLPPSSADLDSTEFFTYIEKIREDEDVRQLSVYIETPEQWGDLHGEIRGGAIKERS